MNKKCCECTLEASVRLINIDTDGCMSEINLCEMHAKEHAVFKSNAYFIADGLQGKQIKKILSNNCCPSCGVAQEWVEQQKRFGCPHCKEFFKNICKHWLTGFKNITIHFGKIPIHSRLKDAYNPRLNYWNNQMQAYTITEDFERARICKKQIQTLERYQQTWGK